MIKLRGMISIGIIISILSALGLSGCSKNDFSPSANAVITEIFISYSGMVKDSQYFFGLESVGDATVFSGEYNTYTDDGDMTSHKYENVPVDASYMDDLRKLAAENDLIGSIKKYREPKIKIEVLDGDMKSTTVLMSDGTQKTVPCIFGSEYYSFFVSIAEKYADYDTGYDFTGHIGE